MQGNQAEINQQVAIALERLNGRMETFEAWRVERDEERKRQEDRRDTAIEKQPDALRSAFDTYGGCLGQIVVTLISGISTLVAITALIITLRR